MSPPENAQIFETIASKYWFDSNGIVSSISKKVAPLSLEQTKQLLDEILKTLDGRKVCMLIDVTNASESTREVREYVALEFPKFVKAIAMISNSALGRMLANLFFSLKEQPYPTKMFNNEAEAREWLKSYLYTESS